jgi:hypothetical protein
MQGNPKTLTISSNEKYSIATFSQAPKSLTLLNLVFISFLCFEMQIYSNIRKWIYKSNQKTKRKGIFDIGSDAPQHTPMSTRDQKPKNLEKGSNRDLEFGSGNL